MPRMTRDRARQALLVAALASAPFGTAHAADDRPSLCGTGEEAIFSCAIGPKRASLCASHDLDASKGTMTYRFGRPGKVELAYPDVPQHPSKTFTAGIDNTPADFVRFTRQGTTYTVYSAMIRSNNPHTEGGVIVSKGSKVLARLICNDHDDGLGGDAWKLMYGAKLPQDPNDALEPPDAP